ncbi:MAG: type II toxin-antitoxin system Phd/YefM family antitoxin [Phyllobacteriaceae bacterium]|nr:type II toxin-antitoxin system Phd/YefM family antitoxin [Phyllobacteriaceae bacterium]
MRTFAAFDAKTHFSKLLDLVEAGEEVRITRHGKPVARLVAERPRLSQSEFNKLLDTMDRIRSRSTPGGPVKELVDEGRRY